MLLIPKHLTLVPWRYMTVRLVAKWNEMFPDLHLEPNVHQQKTATTEFIAVTVGPQEFNQLTVWGLCDDFQAGFGEECRKRMQEEEWCRISQEIAMEDYPAFQNAKDFLQFARHQDVCRWLRDRKLLARSRSDMATELRKMLPDLEFRESVLRLLK
nr:MAG TPA: hypothetical protein [Caudoviricetes sp.]